MTYQTEIEKIEQPLTAELYKMLIGNEYYYFTSHEVNIVFGGQIYLPRPIKRTGFSVEKSMKTVDVTISTPISVMFGTYLAASPYAKTLIEITKVIVSSPDTLHKLIFSGMVYTVSIKKGIASVLCKSMNGLLSRRIPRITYQTNCNWSLFSAQCGLSASNYEYVTTVGTITGNDLELPGITGISSNKYQGGTIAFGTEKRLITNHVNTTITVLVQFADIAIGNSVILYPGCNGSPTACASFGNKLKFMGMPHIPTKNALLWGFR